MPLESLVGGAAAFCTTVSYVPQLKKVCVTKEAADLSLKMLVLLASGLALWIAYGIMHADIIVIAANAISLCLLSCLITFKLRERPRLDQAAIKTAA